MALRNRSRHPPHPRRRRGLRIVVVLVLLAAAWVASSLVPALTAPGNDSMAARTAEWARSHHLGLVVGTLEKVQYALSPPKVGGRPSSSALRQLAPVSKPTPSETSTPTPGGSKRSGTRPPRPAVHAPLRTQVSKALPGEGVFRAVVRAAGRPVLQVAYLRPDAVHTSYLDGVVWIDHRAASWELHPGFEDPGHLSLWNQPDWVAPNRRSRLLSTFNGGFKTPESRGGFYENGHTAGTLLSGAASLVIHRGGNVTLGSWDHEVSMTPDVVAVRQNLRLLIDHGKLQPNLARDVESSWGLTLGGGYAVWRSGVGIDAHGDVVVVMGPALTVTSLAALLFDAGAVRGMEMDINPAWMSFMWYTPGSTPNAPVPHKLVDFERPANRYFTHTSRDFFALYLR